MAALIEFVCIAEHGRRGEASVTLEQRAWAYCIAGAADDHVWARIDPTPVETLRSRVSNGRAHLVADATSQHSLSR